MMKKILFIIGLLFLAVRADAVVFNSNTMINITASPYSAVAASTSNILLNGSSNVWSNGSPGYDTLTVDADYKDVDTLINTAGTTESCHSNTLTVTNSQLYLLAYTLVNNSGQVPTLTGTGGFPTTTLTANPNEVTNYIGFTASGTSLVLTLTNTAAGNNVLTFSLVTATDNTTAINSAVTAALAAGLDIYVPPGVFVVNPSSSSNLGGAVRFFGHSAGTTIWNPVPSTLLNVSSVNNMNASLGITGNEFRDLVIIYFGLGPDPFVSSGKFVIANCVYNTQPGINYGVDVSYPEYWNNASLFSIEFLNSIFHANSNYMLTSFYNLGNLLADGNTFDGYSSQGPISILSVKPGYKRQITNNTFIGNGSTTAIFIPSNRQQPFENFVIENNKFNGFTQETIAPDGLGNEGNACPTIANGPIASVSNDGNGRLVVGMADMLWYYNSQQNQAFTVAGYISANPTVPLTNFYFTLGQGSGQEGVVAKIYNYSSANNTVTLNCFISSANVTVGGDCGIQAGFFNFSIKNNWIEDCGTGISLYLNVFGFDVEGNTVIGCNNGIQVMGGLMVSTYYTLAYNNLVNGNTFINCGMTIYPGYPVNGSVSFFSDYTTRRQYGNRFVNNIVRGGAVNITSQGKFTWAGNQIDPGTPVNWTP